MSGIGRIEQAFARRREAGGKALVIYLMAGDPDVSFTEALVPRLAEAGADLVELGFPFSDPVADGPVIQAAGTRARRNLDALPDYLALVRRIRAATEVPLLLMGYYNPVFRYGDAAFLKDAAAAGLDGAIIPDRPIDEAGDWPALCREHGVAPVLLEAPNSDETHARRIAEAAGGFIYMVSLKGVTGAERGLGTDLRERAARLRQWASTPLAVGFGISTPQQARTAGEHCDGVVVGSGVVGRIGEAQSPAAAERAVLEYVHSLRAALDGEG